METGWEKVDKWYDDLVGDKGLYYHRQVILPKLLPLLQLDERSSLLDLACGQGILSRVIPPSLRYHGIDIAPSLIEAAQKRSNAHHLFSVGDICQPLPIKEKNFTHATIVLALQNVESPLKALQNAAAHLVPNGTLAIVLNHPCFRIPRHTHWEVDEQKKIRYRRVDRYLSPLKIPIQTHPGKGKLSPTTWTFHHSLTDFSRFLFEAGFTISLIEEWISDKKSEGGAAAMENRARVEFPLFLAIKAKKSYTKN